MGSKPKAQDYQASEAEKASASTAMAEYKYFKQKYDPLLQAMRDQSLTADVQSGVRGRANADTMQALTSAPSYQQTQSRTAAGDMAQAVQGQLGAANVAAKDVQNKMQTNVLGTARGQVADAQSGMAQASRLATSEALTRARANQQVAQAKVSAAGQIAGATLAQGLDNLSTSVTPAGPVQPGTTMQPIKGGFFTPAAGGGRVTGAKNRLNYSQFFSG